MWKEPEISKSIPVRPDGKISLPLVGEFRPPAAHPCNWSRTFASKLKTYITNPDVNVIVQQINSEKFNVLGRVANRAPFLDRSTTVLDASRLPEVSGFRKAERCLYSAPKSQAVARHGFNFNYKDVVKGKHLEQNVKLEPGDTVIVP